MKEWIRTEADKLAVDKGCYFDLEKALKVKNFVEKFCTLNDGERAGQPVVFLDWIWKDIVAPLYGWCNPDGTRRFRRGSVWTPRKQTKTTTLACLALYQLLEEPAAQVYLVSSTIETASHLYRIAADMTEANSVLSKRLWCRRNVKTIEDKKKNSLLKVLSGDKTGKSGHNSSCTFFDELAEIKDPEAWYRLYDSGMSRKQPVWLSISTPQYDRNSLAWDQYKKAVAVRDGKDLDTNYLAVVHGVPQEVEISNPDNWWQYIPSLGQTVTKEYYLAEYETAKNNPRELCRFRNLLLAQWTESLEGWLPVERIEACASKIDEAALAGQRCYVGIDGSVSQLAAYVLYFPDQKILLPRFFHPEETAEKSDEKKNTNYKSWKKAGLITLTDGDLFDWEFMKASLIKDSETFEFIEVGFDPYNLESRMIEIDLGCPIIAVPPSKQAQAPATKHLERLVCSGELKIQDNDCLIWNFKNAAVKQDAHERIVLDRDKAGGRYDAVAAFVLALNRYLSDESDGDCVYNYRGVITI